MARFGEVGVKRAGCGAVSLERNDGGFAGPQGLDDPLIGIIGLIGDQQIGFDLRQQGVGAGQVVNLSRGQPEGQRVAERVDQGMGLGAQPALAAAERLILVLFWAPALC